MHSNLQHFFCSKQCTNSKPRCPHQLHTDGGIHSPRLLESPGEVEQSGSQRRLQHDEHCAKRSQPRRVRMRRRAGQQADALPGQLLHDPEPALTLTQEALTDKKWPSAVFSKVVQGMFSSFIRVSSQLNLVSRKASRYIAHSQATHVVLLDIWRTKHFTVRWHICH